MINSFEHISDQDRVWIFGSSRKLNEGQRESLIAEIESFLSQWKAHGKELRSAVTIEDDLFIIISVDESFEKASGCSIDSMVHFINAIESRTNLNLTDRALIFYKNPDNLIKRCVFNEIRSKVDSGEIGPTTKIYNTALSTGIDLKQIWVLEANESWLARYFQKSSV